MVNLKIWILNSLILLMFVNIFSYSAPEYGDREYIVDEFSSKFNENDVTSFLFNNNVILISGGCYNIEQLFVAHFMKLNIPLNEKWGFLLKSANFNTLEFSNSYFGFGLKYNFNNAFSAGFLANPQYFKRESDISLLFNFNGFNTNNELMIMLENFDNNYSHKNKNYVIPEPRIYVYPDYNIDENIKFPINFFFQTTGYIKNIKFYSVFIKKGYRKAHYYTYDNSLGYIYNFTLDSASVYSRTKAELSIKTGNYDIKIGGVVNIYDMENAYADSSNNFYYEDDKRLELGVFGEYIGNWIKYSFEYVYGNRFVNDSFDNIYNKNYHIFYPAIIFNRNNIFAEFGEIINYYDSYRVDMQDSMVDRKETRLLMNIRYRFNDNASVYILKGFETDSYDIRNGGVFFFYDKMYVQFIFNFDSYIKRE